MEALALILLLAIAFTCCVSLVVSLILAATSSPFVFFFRGLTVIFLLLRLLPFLIFVLLSFLYIYRPVLFVLDEIFCGVKDVAPAPWVISREPQVIVLEEWISHEQTARINAEHC